jgi:hypothetical protein
MTALTLGIVGSLVATAGGWSPTASALVGAANGLAAVALAPFLPRRGIVTLGAALPLAACLLPAGAAASVPMPYLALGAMVPVALFGTRRAEGLVAAQAAALPAAALVEGGAWMTVLLEGEGPQPTARLLPPRPTLPKRDPERRRHTRRIERQPVLVGDPR